MRIGRCPYCLLEKRLVRPHALPDAFTRAIKRENSGKVLYLSVNGGASERQDDGSGFLLCNECESILNRNFDHPVQRMLRRISQDRAKYPSRCFFRFSGSSLAGFIVSVIWRAALLDTYLYRDFKLDDEILDAMHTELWNWGSLKRGKYRYSMNAIVDGVAELERQQISQLCFPQKQYAR